MRLEEALRDPARATEVHDDRAPRPALLARLGELVSLESLRLDGARELPPGIGRLTKLRTLALGPRLTDVPDELAALGPTLEALWLDGGHPDDLERVVSLLAPAPRLTDLRLYGARELPPSVARLKGRLDVVLEPAPGADLAAMVAVLAKVRGLEGLFLRQRPPKRSGADLPLAALAPLRRLRRLKLGFGFRRLPGELGALVNLEELELLSCKAPELPDGLRRWKKLRRFLTDGGLGLTALPEWLSGWKQLEELRLPGNPVQTLPASFGRLSRLRTVWMPHCALATLPDGLEGLTSLRVLGLAGNRLATLPAALVDVAELDVAGNPCEAQVKRERVEPVDEVHLRGDQRTLPGDALLAEQPRRLTLELPRLKALPPEVARLRRLEELELDCAALDLDGALELLAEVPTLRELTLRRVDGPLPASLGRLTGLRKLSAQGASVTALPGSIGALSQLEQLWLRKNALRELPAALGRCARLTHLDVSLNPLRALPATLGGLRELERLGLGGCPLGSLPDELGDLTKLVELHFDAALALSGTRFRAPPPVLARLRIASLELGPNEPPWDGRVFELLARSPSLEELRLDEGAFAALPPELGLLGSLRRLDVERLKVELPPELARCARLERVDLGPDHPSSGVVKARLPKGRWRKEEGRSTLRYVRSS